MKRTLIYLVIGLLIVVNIVLLFRLQKTKTLTERVSDQYAKMSIEEERNSTKLARNMLLQHMAENVTLPIVKSLNPYSGDTILLSDILKQEENTLCFRIKETHCDACVQHGLRLLKQVSEEPGSNIVVLCGFMNTRQFVAFSKAQNKRLSVYNVTRIAWEVDEFDEPYFFVVSKDGKVHNLFVPLKEDERLTERYMHEVQQKYWEEKVNCNH